MGLRLVMWFEIKVPRNIEPKIDISIAPASGGLADILRFIHSLRIGENKLEYMSSRFNIPAKRKNIVQRLSSVRSELIRK